MEAMPATPQPRVEAGQVWADNDPRSAGRTLHVTAVDGDVATCVVLTNSDTVQSVRNGETTIRGPIPRDTVGKTVRVKTRRFVDTASGYRHIGTR